MTKYRCFLSDWFEDVEAESEQDAINQMVEYVIECLNNEPAAKHIIAWETD